MSINRYAKKRDAVEPGIIADLEKAGWQVWQDLPVDLLCFKAGRFAVLEIKTGKGKTRKSQVRQAAFVAQTGCPVVSSSIAALEALGSLRMDER